MQKAKEMKPAASTQGNNHVACTRFRSAHAHGKSVYCGHCANVMHPSNVGKSSRSFATRATFATEQNATSICAVIVALTMTTSRPSKTSRRIEETTQMTRTYVSQSCSRTWHRMSPFFSKSFSIDSTSAWWLALLQFVARSILRATVWATLFHGCHERVVRTFRCTRNRSFARCACLLFSFISHCWWFEIYSETEESNVSGSSVHMKWWDFNRLLAFILAQARN